MTPSRQQHWTSRIGIALILLQVFMPVLGQSLRALAAGADGLPMDLCSAVMSKSSSDSGSGGPGMAAAMDCCTICSHHALSHALPSPEQSPTDLPVAKADFVRTARTWVPRSSFPLQVRPQPPPATPLA
jgi:hypothetical protein